jgi:hypothetical protein
MVIRPPRSSFLAHVSLFLLVASCTTPDVAPTPDANRPVIARAEFSGEHAQAKAPAPPEVVPPERSTPEPAAPEPAAPEPPPTTPTPWGSPLELTGKSRGLHWTTTAQVEHTAAAPQLSVRVELHNSTRAPMKISLHPPLALVMTAPAPGSTGEGIGIGMRGEGMGSDTCSPGHGGPATLPAGGRSYMHRTVELDPLPWPPGQALRVTASSRDCRPGRLDFEVLDVLVVQPASPDGVPTLMPAKAARAREK